MSSFQAKIALGRSPASSNRCAEGVMAITAGDSNFIRGLTLSNIRVDRIERSKTVRCQI
jgi:hypothetical protein